jgi:4-diphosphocytidyl-2-C-methyl-D-erythritol kinase
MGAGLGGGSADAAATLIALNKLWNLNLLPDDLYKIGLELGADVPVCLYSQLNVANAAFFSGIGEVITPAPMLPQIYFVLVNPNIHLATQDVFRSYQGNFSNYKNFDVSDNFIEALKARSNDLEQAAGALCPEISTALESLLHQNGCALSRMTGSGSTCFGIFLNQEEARFAAKEISTQHPKWFVKTAELI